MQKIEAQVQLRAVPPANSGHAHHHHDHEHGELNLAATIISVVLFVLYLLYSKQLREWSIMGEYAIALTAYFLAGYNVLKAAAQSLRRGVFFDENTLMSIATLGAFAIDAMAEAIGVMIFYKIGELIQDKAVHRSRNSIKSLLEIQPEFAHLAVGTATTQVSPEQVAVGSEIVVKVGEKIPLDGVVIAGESRVDNSALTGESKPISAKLGAELWAGAINLQGVLRLRTTKAYADTTVARILDLVENASAKKAQTDKFITRFARYYTPIVFFLALGVALLPPLLGSPLGWQAWIYRALVLLVMSCPCALLISIPLGYFGGIGGASRRGILVKGANVFDALHKLEAVAWDKTGTLTQGVFEVLNIVPHGELSTADLLQIAVSAEQFSNHPIAQSIVQMGKKQGINPANNWSKWGMAAEIAGQGLEVPSPEGLVLAGNAQLMQNHGVELPDLGADVQTVVYLAQKGEYLGYINIGDEIKSQSFAALGELRRLGVQKAYMLTGDSRAAGHSVGQKLGIDQVFAELLPPAKLQVLESLLEQHGNAVAFVGDGINDAPALARASVGIAMGQGSAAALESADVVLMGDDPGKVATAIQVSRRTQRIIKQNIALALVVKSVFIGFGSFGLAGMWEAVFADVGTALLAVLNATRVLR
ncbi:MAG: heavy metal translocating P-type ATPase [Fibrobacter sp.]|nr:heavy metal translocating P-type ATPase [Fibrobacter sp.]